MNNVVALPWVNLNQAVANATAKRNTPRPKRKVRVPPLERDAAKVHEFLNEVDGPYIMLGMANGELVTCWNGSFPRLLWMNRQLEQVLIDGYPEG